MGSYFVQNIVKNLSDLYLLPKDWNEGRLSIMEGLFITALLTLCDSILFFPVHISIFILEVLNHNLIKYLAYSWANIDLT